MAMFDRRIPLKITFIYVIFAVLWIILTEILLSLMIEKPLFIIHEAIKESIFVLITASVLYLLINRYTGAIKKTQTELLESHERFKNIVEAVNDWIWEVDENAVYTYASPKVFEILGYKPEEIIGKTPFDLMPPDEAKRVADIFNPVVEARNTLNMLENTNLHKDGRRIVLETSGVPIFDVNRQLKGYRGIDRDITERKKVEERLTEEKTFSDEAINSLPGIFYIFDVKGNFIRWNKNAEIITGFSQEEISKKRPLDFFSGEDRKVISEKILEAFEKGKSVAEVNIITKKGKPIPHLFTGLRFIKNDQMYLIGEAIDITEQKWAQEAITRKDREIRRAYVDVFAAVTGGKLILMTPDEIKESLGKTVTKSYSILSDKGLSGAREKIKKAIELQSLLQPQQIDDMIVAASEAMTNAIKHGGGDNYQVFKKDTAVQIMISDKGPGIDFSILPKATLLSGFSTKQSLGMGFSFMLEFCDRVLLSTQPGNTIVVLEITAQ